MLINSIRLNTTRDNLQAARAFYHEGLQVPIVAEGADSLTLRVGASQLIFEVGVPAFYHFAFNIPPNQFDEAKTWLQSHLTLIADNQGTVDFHFESWQADSVYFYDPLGNIVELIARHRLQDVPPDPFSAASFLSISEIGVVAKNVPGTVEGFLNHMALSIFDGEGSDTFTVVGDDHGLLIVVKRDRIWYPETGKPAQIFPLEVSITDQNGDIHELLWE